MEYKRKYPDKIRLFISPNNIYKSPNRDAIFDNWKRQNLLGKYIAICEGTLPNNCGTINAPISRKEGSIIERCVNNSGDVAITHYSVIKACDKFSVVNLNSGSACF